MSTHHQPIIGFATKPDGTNECYFPPVDIEMSLATGLMKNIVATLKDPSADNGFYSAFDVQPNYIGTPKVIVKGYLDGTPSTNQINFFFKYLALADNESIEQAWVETVLFNTGSMAAYAAEDLLVLEGTLAANFTANDHVPYYFGRAVTSDTFVGDFHVTSLQFKYNDA